MIHAAPGACRLTIIVVMPSLEQDGFGATADDAGTSGELRHKACGQVWGPTLVWSQALGRALSAPLQPVPINPPQAVAMDDLDFDLLYDEDEVIFEEPSDSIRGKRAAGGRAVTRNPKRAKKVAKKANGRLTNRRSSKKASTTHNSGGDDGGDDDDGDDDDDDDARRDAGVVEDDDDDDEDDDNDDNDDDDGLDAHSGDPMDGEAEDVIPHIVDSAPTGRTKSSSATPTGRKIPKQTPRAVSVVTHIVMKGGKPIVVDGPAPERYVTIKNVSGSPPGRSCSSQQGAAINAAAFKAEEAKIKKAKR